MAKATVVSLCPFPVDSFKPGLAKGYYTVPKAEHGDLSVLLISDTHYFQYIPGTGRSIQVAVSGDEIARSIVYDYLKNVVGLSDNARPGLFFVEGEQSKESVKKNHLETIKFELSVMLNWYRNLIMTADQDWEKTKNYNVVTETQRHALKVLGMKRDWAFSIQDALQANCHACKSVIHPDAIICPICHTVLKEEEYKKLKIAV